MEILITRADGALNINPAPPYITDYLKYSHRSFDVVYYKRVNKFETRFLYTTDGHGGVSTLPGFFTMVCSLVNKNSDKYIVNDLRTVLPEADWDAIKNINWAGIESTGFRDYQVEVVVDFLFKAREGSGIVNATGGVGKTLIMAATYAAFNPLNTILAVPLKQVFLQTHEKFCKLFPDRHIGKVGDGMRDISNEITISTFASLKNCAMEKCQLLLVDEIQSTTGDAIAEVFSHMTPIRSFGYTATDKGLFNGAEKVIKGLFGERLIYMPYKEAQEVNAVVPVVVYFIKVPSDHIMMTANTIEGKFSQGIKNCDVRNKLIGEVCNYVPDGWQTIVFVDHVMDHLVKVHKEMPSGTKFLHRESSKKKAGSYALTKGQQNKAVAAFQENEAQFLIATDAFRAGVDIPNCRVVVQGAGGSSEIEILQEAYRASRILPENSRERLDVSAKTHAVVIDFLDSHDSTLEGMSNKRMEIYRKEGWKIKIVNEPKEIDWNDFQKDIL